MAAPAPLPATFAELGVPDSIVAELARQGISKPFAIQSRVLPDALAGRDVLGRAQTGSGKTLAFGLPMLTRLADLAGGSPRRTPKAPRGLVLVPTRELALQVADVLVPLGRSLGMSVITVYGGVGLGGQISRLRQGVDVVVATPGRLMDVMDRHACTLGEVAVTVLDEADHMADLGFLPSVTRILDATPPGQRMLFSATLDRDVARLVTSYLGNPALHAIAPAVTAADAEHQIFVLPAQDKVTIATEIAGRDGRTIFFVRTKHGADRLAKQLTRAGIGAAAIHGNLSQNQPAAPGPRAPFSRLWSPVRSEKSPGYTMPPAFSRSATGLSLATRRSGSWRSPARRSRSPSSGDARHRPLQGATPGRGARPADPGRAAVDAARMVRLYLGAEMTERASVRRLVPVVGMDAGKASALALVNLLWWACSEQVLQRRPAPSM